MAVTALDEWHRLTRFLESARVAFDREANLWSSLEIDEPREIKLAKDSPNGSYEVGLSDHLRALEDDEILHTAVLVHSYALVESAAATRLGISQRKFNGIEEWGTRLLATTGRSWDDLRYGKAGAAEVAVMRNLFAHGSRELDEASRDRLVRAGGRRREVGEKLTLTYVQLRGYRKRLLALMRAGGIAQ